MRSIVILCLLAACGDPAGATLLPPQVTGTVVSPGRIHLSWNAVAGASEFTVLRGASPGGETPLTTIPATQTTFDADVTPGETSCWQVSALVDGTVSEPSDELCLTTSATCGNGMVDTDEICDDGNTLDGDGCDATCGQATCFVPVTHATIGAALADVACPDVWIAAGVWSERVTIDRDVRVHGVGAQPVVLDGSSGGTVITVAGATTVLIEDVTVRNGYAPQGGGILDHGALTLRRVRVEDNVAESELVAQGGGIYSDGDALVLEDTIVTGNRATTLDTSSVGRVLAGGGIYTIGAALDISGGSIEQNRLTGTNVIGLGGGIASDENPDGLTAPTELIVQGAVVRDNAIALVGTSSGEGGGVYYRSATLAGDLRCSFTSTEISNNQVQPGGSGGGIMVVVSSLFSSVSFEMLQSTVSSNQVGEGNGGGIGVVAAQDDNYTVAITIDRSRITGNRVASGANVQGGGLWIAHGPQFEDSRVESSVEITRSEISDNTIEGTNTDGGGIYYQCHICDAQLTLRQSTVSGNLSAATASAKSGGISTNDTRAVIVDSTISGNEARSSAGVARGGGIGIHTHEHGGIAFFNATIAANVVTAPDSAGGGIYLDAFSDESFEFEDRLNASFANTIIANNAATQHADCGAEVDPLVFYEARSDGYNLFGDVDTCSIIAGTDDQNGVDPLLLPLGDNGGVTATQALDAGSPALDRGNPAGCLDSTGTSLTVDQRDLARVANGRCDIGAYEQQ